MMNNEKETLKHYSKNELLGYHNNELNDILTLEIDNHLACCEQCSFNYIDVIEENCELFEPSQGFAYNVIAALPKDLYKNKKVNDFGVFLRYAVAASLCIMLFKFGVFDILITKAMTINSLSYNPPKIEEKNEDYSFAKAKEDIQEFIKNIFNNIKKEVINNEKK